MEENTVLKKELIQFIAERRGLKIKDATKAVDNVFESIEELLINHKSVSVPHFGKFTSEMSKPKKVYDFLNEKVVMRQPTWVVSFEPYKMLRYEVKNGRKMV